MIPLGLIPAWAWRWIAGALIGVSLYGVGYLKGRAGEEEKLVAYQAAVKATGDAQNAIAHEKELTWKKLVEATENEAQIRTDDLNAQLDAARLRNAALASRRIVPQPAPGTAGGGRVCYAAEQLDRGLREALGGLYRRVTELAEEGQRARDLAADCAGYVKAISEESRRK